MSNKEDERYYDSQEKSIHRSQLPPQEDPPEMPDDDDDGG